MTDHAERCFMTVLVTGGAGFIGSNFIFYMLKAHPDYRIVCYDALTYAGNLSTLSSVLDNPRFRFVKGDICDREAVYKLFEEEKFDYVVHFAAESHVDRSIEDPGIFVKTNVLGTQVLLDAAVKYGVKRFIMSAPTKCTEICLSTVPICSSLRRSRSRPAVPTPLRKLHPIFS